MQFCRPLASAGFDLGQIVLADADRYGKFTDPFGHQWGVATHVEDVAPEEMQRRSEEMTKKMAKAAGQSS